MAPTLLDRVRRGVSVGLQAARGAPDLETVEKQLDASIAAGALDGIPEVSKEVPRKRKSLLDIRKTDRDLGYAPLYRALREFGGTKKRVPIYGSIDRDYYLSEIWHEEPILAGAIYSMSAKMTALKWRVTGRKNLAMSYAKLLSRAAYMEGFGWGGFSASTTVDFFTVDRGSFWETPRVGSRFTGKLADIGHIDSLACTLTGNTKHPMVYDSEVTGQSLRFRHGQYVHFASLPSSREKYLGIGFCAVSRALKAAHLLIGLHKYDSEKLANLPPEGVASVTGLTMDEFKDALRLWKAARKKDDSLTFPQVLWLIGSQPNVQVTVDFVGFSQVPESFDRQTVVVQYVNTVALCFGVDSREFWPISTSTLGTAAESEIQHMKARGKGPGEYITATERAVNNELPEGVDFSYDTQDMEEDMIAAGVAKGWVDAFLPLTTAGGAAEELITKDEFMRLLADKDVIPDWMVKDGRVVIDDSEVHQKEWSDDPMICVEWDDGVLKQVRMPTYAIRQATQMDPVPLALPIGDNGDSPGEFKEDDPERNIRGKPIPESEALRGSTITGNAIKLELELWRKHPELAKYAPMLAEEDEVALPKK